MAGFTAPPAGVILATLDDLARHRDAVRRQAVDATTMPLGNMTGMTPDERAALGAWLAALPQ